jgi:hypothetical protein
MLRKLSPLIEWLKGQLVVFGQGLNYPPAVVVTAMARSRILAIRLVNTG